MIEAFPLLADAKLEGKRALIRAGFDVPIEDGKVTDTRRIVSVIPTIKFVLDAGGSVVLMAHQGRPKGKPDPAFSQKPLLPELKTLLGCEIQFVEECVGERAEELASALRPGEVLLLENLRYDPREKENDKDFATQLAALGDVYINDAFTNCHREHASMVGVPKILPAYMGLNLQKEVQHLSQVFDDPHHPITLIVSGAKMETKVPVIESFLNIGDDILVGGCIANTFIAARGFDVGSSKYEEEEVEKAQEIMLESEKAENACLHIPRDAIVASEVSDTAEKVNLPVENVTGDMKIFDVGKVTIERFKEIILKSGMIVWNGPLGLYECNRFSHATKRIAEAIAEATENGAISIIGGGDTLDFHDRYEYSLDAYSFVSTGGGAMLEFISGKPLPALEALKQL